MKRILIIEDDQAISAIEKAYLVKAGFDVRVEEDGNSGLKTATDEDWDLILLDVMLPGLNGFSICRKLRESKDIPILMVTALEEDAAKIKSYGLGADDFIEKPFSLNVLVARVKGMILRYETLKNPAGAKALPIQAGNVTLDPLSHQVQMDGKPLSLTNKEYQLLWFLASHPDEVFSREALYNEIWGPGTAGDTATISVHINRLRDKLESNPGDPKHIITVWGVGYKFVS